MRRANNRSPLSSRSARQSRRISFSATGETISKIDSVNLAEPFLFRRHFGYAVKPSTDAWNGFSARESGATVGKKKATQTVSSSHRAIACSAWLPSQLANFWVRLQVYPDAIAHPEKQKEYEQKARAVLRKSGTANLRYLCDSAGLKYRPEHDSPDQLANKLLKSDARDELIYLATFLRSRVTAVVEYFDTAKSENDRFALEGEIANLSERRPETPKPMTKLVSLYRSNPASLELVHYRHAWRRLPTIFSYTAVSSFPKTSISRLSKGMKDLVSRLGRQSADESFEEFGHSQLTGETTIFVVHRCFPPSVRADYQKKFRLQHDFSTLAFAIDTSVATLLIKVANRALADEIRSWVAETLEVELRDSGASLFTEYQPESVEDAFLGGYEESHGIDLTQIEFHHSFGPNHSPLALRAAELSRSVREDLKWLKTSGILRIRSLSEIAQFTVRFEGHEVDVTGVVEKGGAVRFKINDAGIEEDRVERLQAAFQNAFLIPLGQSIDPTLLAMGPSEIYQYLLSGVTDDQVQPYQKPALAKLIEAKVLKIVDGRTGRCTNLNCGSHAAIISDESVTECPACQGELTWQKFRRYDEDTKELFSLSRELLQRATGWKLAPRPQKFESQKFHRLSPGKDSSQTVCVILNDRLNSAKVETFQRAMFPVVVVHPQGLHRLPVIDEVGIAHLGLPYAIAASEDKADWQKFRQSCRDVIVRLRRMESERVLRASRRSHELICNKPPAYDDRNYEADVYNLLRSLFPYTVKWGGKNKSDGWGSLVYFESNDLKKPTKFNWSYDAKYSETTYSFEIGEFRQMFDYVCALFRPKRLMVEGNQYDAHVIITNSMDEKAMKNAADYLWASHRLGKDHPTFRLVFMRDAFLIRLWELVRESEQEFTKRQTYLPEFLVTHIKDRMADGFTVLDQSSAEEIAAVILRQQPVEAPVDGNEIKKDLATANATKSRPANRPGKLSLFTEASRTSRQNAAH